MRERQSSAARAAARSAALTVDVILLTPRGQRLALLLTRKPDARPKERWELPWDGPRAGESLEEVTLRLVRGVLGVPPAWVRQIGAFGGGRHPGGADVSIAFLGLVPSDAPAPMGGEAAWFPIDDLPPLAPRQRAMLDATLAEIRTLLDTSPIAFRLLPTAFTLSQLQEIYELLLGRRLHKASFRRALHAAWLIEPTEEWRSEGRGRPAQLFRYAPRKRRGSARGVRFDGVVG